MRKSTEHKAKSKFLLSLIKKTAPPKNYFFSEITSGRTGPDTHGTRVTTEEGL